MRRGPKPKNTKCLNCDKRATSRNYCKSCYCKAIRNGTIIKLEPKELPSELTQIQKEVLVGSLLGDGCLFKYKVTHKPHLIIVRKIADKTYAQWEIEILKDFICRIREGQTYDNRTHKTYQWIKFVTHRSTTFEPYYKDWYPKGIKVVPKSIELTPLVLAVWFCDDGNIRPSCSPWRMRLTFGTDGFTKQDAKRLALILNKRYNAFFSTNYYDGKPRITTCDNGTRKFIAEIDNHLPAGMERKAYWRKPEARFYSDVPPLSSGWAKNKWSDFDET